MVETAVFRSELIQSWAGTLLLQSLGLRLFIIFDPEGHFKPRDFLRGESQKPNPKGATTSPKLEDGKC